MTAIKPSSHGIVVDHVESGVRFAISDKNYNVKFHRKVRDLGPGESVLSFRPLRRESLSSVVGGQGSTQGATKPAGELEGPSKDVQQDTKTEGAAPAASQEKKEGN